MATPEWSLAARRYRFLKRGLLVWLACCLSRGPQAPLNAGDIEQLANEMGEDAFAGDIFVFLEGEPAARVHIVRAGLVELSKLVNGRRVILQLLRPGDVFGDVPTMLGESEPFDARAIEDSVVLSLEALALFSLLQTRPRVAQRWFMSLAERVAGLQTRLVDLLAGSLEAQLASILLGEAGSEGEVHLAHGQLADLLGVQRSSVQRVLKSLESAGLLAFRYRRIDLVDQAGLLSLIDAYPESSGV